MTMMDDIANDLSLWIDQTAESVAAAFAPSRAPFSAHITEDQKLDFYRTRLFNPDGSPNSQGRNEEIARLGAEGFGRVYQAVVRRYPQLKPPEPAPITVPEQWPGSGGPPGSGPPTGPTPGPGVMPALPGAPMRG